MPPYRRTQFNNDNTVKQKFVKPNQSKMARGEGEADAQNHRLMSHFVEKVGKIPMVHFAWDYAEKTYSTIKESNRLVNFTLTNAERSVHFVAGQAIPVVMKFEKQIQVVDELACKGLGTLEEKVPLITKHPDQIIDDTKNLYSDAVTNRIENIRNYGKGKVKNVTDYGLQKASTLLNNPLVSSIMKSVDGALMITENYVDYVLPPNEDDTSKQNNVNEHREGNEKHNPLSRISKISTTIRKRTYRTVILRTQALQNRTADLMNIRATLITFGIESAENLNDYVVNLWIILSADNPDEKNYPKNFPLKQIIPIARPVLRRFLHLYSEVLNRLQFSSGDKSESNHVGNHVNHKVGVSDVIRDNAALIVEIIRSVPIHPNDIYSWLSQLVSTAQDKVSKKNHGENNCVQQDHRNDQNHVQKHDNCVENNVD